MIEVIYKDEKQEMKDGTTEWELPKNIRQIGLVSGDYRIYIEDYVYTFLHRAAQTKGRDEENGSCQLKRRLLVQAPVALPRCFAEILYF